MLYEVNNYREILKNEFERRVRNNSSYSLRAFSRDIHLNPSRVSEIFNGKQGLSGKCARSVAQALSFNEEETEFFHDLVESVHARSCVKRNLARIRLRKYSEEKGRQIRLDLFTIVSDWYHFAILELCEVKGFQDDPSWVAKSLGIKISEAREAMERLVRVGLAERMEGTFTPVDDFTFTPTGIPSEAIKKFHSQVMEKARSSLYQDPVEERDFGSIMMAASKDDFDEAKTVIKKFKKDLRDVLNRSQKKDSIYCLSVQFFNLLQKDEELL